LTPPTPASPSPSPASPDEAHSGPSTGAKIGIGVGVSVAGILGLTAAAWFMLHKRQNRSRLPEAEHRPTYEKAELHGETKPRTELDNQGHVREMSGKTAPGELEGVAERHELYGDCSGHELSGEQNLTM
jgi:hypothetical protein